MHDLSAQQPRIPHALRHVNASPIRASGYEVDLTYNDVRHTAPFGRTVTQALSNAELYVIQNFPGHKL